VYGADEGLAGGFGSRERAGSPGGPREGDRVDLGEMKPSCLSRRQDRLDAYQMDKCAHRSSPQHQPRRVQLEAQEEYGAEQCEPGGRHIDDGSPAELRGDHGHEGEGGDVHAIEKRPCNTRCAQTAAGLAIRRPRFARQCLANRGEVTGQRC
jgi:hypothetical protein